MNVRLTTVRSFFSNPAHRRVIFSVVLALFLFAIISKHGTTVLTNAYEDLSLRLFPSAQRYFDLGGRHFDAQSPSRYDIARAEYFFGKAADIDATTPYLYHELARIAFLKGDFEVAMALIDTQIQLMGDNAPNSYYIRALIEGYKGEYAASATDYVHFLQFQPTNWAATNDYAWVLLKAGRAKEAAAVTGRALEWFPDNPWLLNTNATALYEMHENAGALQSAQKASIAVSKLSEAEWLQAYPGNDPKIADKGIAAFKRAVQDNIHSITLALASGALQSNVKP
ncbi:hypothetical protein EXS56_01615 [Candidatus Kaiserbacteria bacterium]|nr:hypothetical protein [Candidatus Kaiserbacteria bacterium]